MGTLLNVNDSLAPGNQSAKDVIEHVLLQLIEFKRSNFELSDAQIYAEEHDNVKLFEQHDDVDYYSDIDQYDDLVE